MSIPKFKNKSNDHIKYEFESENTKIKVKQEYWISRAVTVEGIIFASKNEKMYVLTTKRTRFVVDGPNKYCVPGGYLDWNETGYDAMVREVYEETTLYLYDIGKYCVFSNKKQPFFVMVDPDSDPRENVGLFYISVFDFPEDKFPVDIELFKSKETAEVKWMPIKEIGNYEWAFSHDEYINDALSFVMQRNGL
jgi:ADP-ribose pyrophosphatase YjhB (NUDIX family)